MLNHIVIMGRLTRDPEMRRTGTGIPVSSFCVAVDRDWPNKDTGERETDFINCAAWRQTGEFVSKYFSKGAMIVVSGRLQMRKWTDKDGNKRVSAEVVADNVYFGESKKDKDEQNGAYSNVPYYTPPQNDSFKEKGYYDNDPRNPKSYFAMLDDDDAQLPF